MPFRAKRLAWTAACSAAAAACALALSGPAAAIGPPGTPSAPEVSGSASVTFTWGAPSTPPAEGNGVGYRWSVAGQSGTTAAGTATVALPEGRHTFSVVAYETDAGGAEVPGTESGPATRAVRVDLTAPTISGVLSPARPNGLEGWYTSATVRWTCADPGGSGVRSCPRSPEVFDTARAARDQDFPDRNIQSPRLVIRGTAVDNAGHGAAFAFDPIRFDALAPTPGQPRFPSSDARMGAEPEFRWSRAGNDTSGVDRYEVWVEEPLRVPRMVASVPHVAGRNEFRSARTAGAPIATMFKVTWYVRSIDRAGNVNTSGKRSFTIDPTVPPAPVITAGPEGFTRVTAPVFEWQGAGGGAFSWDLTVVREDDTEVLHSGTGTRAAIPALPDGDYVFRVNQASGVGVVSADATRDFTVDTVAPAPPSITGRPTAGAPVYTWVAEEGAHSRWWVTGAGDAVVQPPTDTPGTSATLGALPAGAYTFRVLQTDPAGNASAPAVESFTVAPAAVAAGPVRRATALPRRNAAKLRPKAGATVRTRRPLLTWKGGPRGATLYNVQLFRVVRRAGGAAPVVRKVHSAFPRGRKLRLPAARTTPGACYIWRVWPFVGKKFSRTPLGISNFCVARARPRR
ncbi:hypothetical protein [Miltoncostaea marina]|uniref:hypothetical protein n=1 Tax=Miltoncostaea marina TaxID=2843215 RepID=UPI001C3E48DF|nr:hypothetical protein [Miltoncostaea marina]